MANVKGTAILGLVKFIRKNMKDRLPAIGAQLPADTKDYLDEHIIISKWYPYKFYTDLLRALDKVAGTGDLSYCIEQGRLSARHDLSSIFKIFVSFKDSQMVLTRAMSIWNSYYDTGSVTIPDFSDHGSIVRIENFPEIDPAHVKNAQGWLEEFNVMCRFRDVRSEIAKCQCSGDPVTEIHFTFTV